MGFLHIQRFLVYVCVIICTLKHVACLCTNVSRNMVQVPSMKNTLISDQSLWTKPGVGSASACASDCARDRRCVSFFYNTDSDICTAHAVKFSSSVPSLVDEGSLYYTGDVDGRDCADILKLNPSSQDGVYIIKPLDDKGAIKVYCDMTTDGGGWTVFQRRQDNSVKFYKDWAAYKAGFGNVEEEFWLGNDIINLLTTAKPSQLRIDMLDQDGQSGFAEYPTFRVENEANNYKLTVAGFSGDRGDSFTIHNDMLFSTLDQDHDTNVEQNCASVYYGGWWYKSCHRSNLNGIYGNTKFGEGIIWMTWHGVKYSLKWTEMKLKPVFNVIPASEK